MNVETWLDNPIYNNCYPKPTGYTRRWNVHSLTCISIVSLYMRGSEEHSLIRIAAVD